MAGRGVGGTLVVAGEAPPASLPSRGRPPPLHGHQCVPSSPTPGGEVGGGWHRAQSHSCLRQGRRAPKFPPHPPPSPGDSSRDIEGRQPARGGGWGGEKERKQRAGDPRDGGKEPRRQPDGAGAPGDQGNLLNGGWPGGGGGEGRGSPGSPPIAVSPGQSLRGRAIQTQRPRGPTLGSLGRRGREEGDRQELGGGGGEAAPAGPGRPPRGTHI